MTDPRTSEAYMTAFKVQGGTAIYTLTPSPPNEPKTPAAPAPPTP